MYNKTDLKAEKRFITKESFHKAFYIPVILFDSVCRKDRSCFRKIESVFR